MYDALLLAQVLRPVVRRDLDVLFFNYPSLRIGRMQRHQPFQVDLVYGLQKVRGRAEVVRGQYAAIRDQ